MPPQATSDFHSAQVRRAVLAVALARAEWRRMPDDFDSGWDRLGPRLALIVESAQLGAARDGAAYIPSALEQQGQSVTAESVVVPAAFAGVAADGRALNGLLYGAVVRAKQAPGSTPTRLAAAQRWLDMTVHTAVADAGRDASRAAVVARPKVKFVRSVNPPCCQRCAVLAGRIYRYSEGFQRHPRCDCSMIPTTVASPDRQEIGPEDVKDLTARQRELLADGKDFNKVINDYQRKRGDFLPPTRVDQLAARRSRREAADALNRAGYLAA